jgi:hypothetical protein
VGPCSAGVSYLTGVCICHGMAGRLAPAARGLHLGRAAETRDVRAQGKGAEEQRCHF